MLRLHRVHTPLLAAAAAILVAGCGSGAAATTPATTAAGDDTLQVSPQNSELLMGVNRIGFAILDADSKPVLHATVQIDIQKRGGSPFEHITAEFIGPEYGDIPVYLSTASFPATGEVEFLVRATLPDGTTHTGHAFQNIQDHSSELPVGHKVTEVSNLKQRIAADVGGDLTRLDTAVANGKADPDAFHDHTIADGVAAHMPMVLYFGEPGRCVSMTCTPTINVVKKLAAEYPGKFWVEHIEVHFPADAETFNAVYTAFGLQSEPWVYFVNKDGVVADRFEGPVSIGELRSAADGTLAGKVPAVAASAG